MAKVPSLEEYSVSPVTGFVPEKQPLQRLSLYFDPLEEIAQNIQRLVAQGTLRATVEKLPLLDHSRLHGLAELNRAHLLFCIVSHTYVWCEQEKAVAKVLPKCLAVPWVAISQRLGLHPVINHNSYILNNWRQVDTTRPLSMDNMKPLFMFTNTPAEEGFIKVPFQVELDFGRSVHNIVEGQQAVLDDNTTGVCKALNSLNQTILQIQASFMRLNEVCDPGDFYNIVRPYLAGWKANPVLPEGLVYEGVSPTPHKYFGGSAAECAVFQVLDEALGVTHRRDSYQELGSGLTYLEEVREYMPPTQREFIRAVGEGPSIKEYVQRKQDRELLLSYNKCVEELTKFRSLHIRIVARIRVCDDVETAAFDAAHESTKGKFVTMQANKNPVSKENTELAKRGTGGSGLMPFLKQIRNETGATTL